MAGARRRQLTVLEELDVLRERVTRRLAELEPLERELAEVRQAAEMLGITSGSVPGGQPASAPRPPRQSIASRPRDKTAGQIMRTKPAARRERMRQVAQLVAEEPGITLDEVASRFDIQVTGLHRIFRRLRELGLVDKQGSSLHPGASTGALAAEEADPPVSAPAAAP